MKNRKIKILFLVPVSLTIIAGILLLILPYLDASIERNSLAGIILLLSGGIIFLEKNKLEDILNRIIDKLTYFFKNEEKIDFFFFLEIFISGTVFRILYLVKPINYNETLIYLRYFKDKTFQTLFFYSSANNFILNNIIIKFFPIQKKSYWKVSIRT